MKRLFGFLSIVVFAICAAQLIYLFAGRNSRLAGSNVAEAAPPSVSLQREPSQRLELPPDQSRSVDFATDEVSFADFTARQRNDQYLDWLLFSAAAALKPSAEEYSRTFYDLPTSRQGYMRPVGSFEFGETRSRFIGDGRVLALIPAARSPSERKDFLASIADEQRKNLGDKFERLVVVEYELDGQHARAALTRRNEIDYATLFSAEFGYLEQQVAKLSDLEGFMKTVPDLTYARRTSDGLLLGGRQILSRPYRSIEVEQVATIWQAEQTIQKALADWDLREKKAENEFKARWRYKQARSDYELRLLESQMEGDRRQVEEQLIRERHDLKIVNGSGFSLDPEIDFPGLKRTFDETMPLFATLGAEFEEAAQATSVALSKGDIVPLRRLRFREDGQDVAERLDRMERDNSYQAARYDGALQGTEAGMILFYTDLLAKLWAIDYADSSPRRENIPDFVDHPSVSSSTIYAAERMKFGHARLWFGHSNLGFQIGDQKSAVLLARTATRIYSAGSNALRPGVEGEASAFLAAPIDWWNDHYQEVARYEPEYERLNQLMKWSIVIGWLNEVNEGDKLGFLANVAVDRSNVFPDWISRHPELKFRLWDHIRFFPAGYKGTTTEALPLLSGPVTRGGVSLANKEVVHRAPLASGIEKSVLRSNLDYAVTKGKDSLTTLDGSIFKLTNIDSNTASAVARAKPGAKFRGATAQLAGGDVERVVALRADAVRVETRNVGVPIGDLEIGTSKNGFTVGWRAREIDRAHTIARTLSASREPDLLLLRDPTVDMVVKFPGEEATYAVKLSDSPRWVKFAPEKQLNVDIAEGWQLRAAAAEDKSLRNMQASVVNEAQLFDDLRGHLVLEAANDGKPLLRVATDASPTDVRMIDIDAGGGTRISAWIKPPSDAVHLSAKEGSAGEAIRIARRLGPDDIAAIRKAAANENNPVVRLSDVNRVEAELAANLRSGDFRKAAAEMAADPATARRAIDAQIKKDLQVNQKLLEEQGPNAALHDLDRLIRVYGDQPELTMRRGLMQIERGNIEAAVDSVQTRIARPLNDRQRFFEEVNARFAGGSRQARSDLYRFAEYVDWTDGLARLSASERGGLVQLAVAEKRLDLHYQLTTMPTDRSLALAELGDLRPGKVIVYRQDSVSLNGLDWTNSVDQSLRQVVTGKLGKVARLQQDIAQYRPAIIWSPDHAIPFKATQAHATHFSPAGYQACNPIVGNCANDNSSDQRQQDVYLVAAN